MPQTGEWGVPGNPGQDAGSEAQERAGEAQKDNVATLPGPHRAFLPKGESGWQGKRLPGHTHQARPGAAPALTACHVREAPGAPRSTGCLVSVTVPRGNLAKARVPTCLVKH